MTEQKRIAKILYQSREVNYIEIQFSDLSHKIEIAPVIDISGKEKIIRLDYIITSDDDKEKEIPASYWDIENYLDKIHVSHTDTGIMITWVSEESIKSSLFIPNEQILHVHVDDPRYNYEQDNEKDEIEP